MRVVLVHVAVVTLAFVVLAMHARQQRQPEGYRSRRCSKTFDRFPEGFDKKAYPSKRMSTNRRGVVKVTCNPGEYGSRGGVILRSSSVCAGAMEIRLTFDVRFGTDSSFDFGMGGKAGLGVQFGTGNIQGGNWLPTAASARLMFREEGRATGYVYYGKRSDPGAVNDQHADYALIAHPTGTAGHDLWMEGRSKAPPLPRFESGTWQTVSIYCKMNSVNRADGVIEISVGSTTKRFDKMRWLDNPAGVNNVQFCTWYGGNTAEWAPKTTESIYFKNLKVTAN